MAALEYLKDPQAIYDASFSTVRAEADLAALPEPLESVAVRMIHACGMPDIVDDLRFDADVAASGAAALKSGAPVIADCEAVAAAITREFLPEKNEIICTLNDARTPGLATSQKTTRSSAAVRLWETDGAIVVIGNAPTALFALMELLDEGAPKPAAILATPVGFVGAAESKEELAKNARGVPYLTLLGRRGGSAMASAALNAIALGTKS